MITKLFSPSRSRILGKHYRLLRNGIWTTNGYIALRTEYEPDWMAELKDTGDNPPDI